MTAGTPWRLSFVALAAIWGASFLFIKVGVEALEPLQVAFARCAIGALVLRAWLAATREPSRAIAGCSATWRSPGCCSARCPSR